VPGAAWPGGLSLSKRGGLRGSVPGSSPTERHPRHRRWASEAPAHRPAAVTARSPSAISTELPRPTPSNSTEASQTLNLIKHMLPEPSFRGPLGLVCGRPRLALGQTEAVLRPPTPAAAAPRCPLRAVPLPSPSLETLPAQGRGCWISGLTRLCLPGKKQRGWGKRQSGFLRACPALPPASLQTTGARGLRLRGRCKSRQRRWLATRPSRDLRELRRPAKAERGAAVGAGGGSRGGGPRFLASPWKR